MTDEEYAKIGREVIANGTLRQMRDRLGLTRNAMSELLHTSPITYASWEARPDVRIWAETAVRVGRFYRNALIELDLLMADGIDLTGLIPFHLAATRLGVPQELLLTRYRAGEFQAVDAGILGLWVRPTNIDEAG
jgi:DNA-binding XRE family transcriptional regulator